MATITHPPFQAPGDTWHADDLAQLPDDGMRYELIRGELFMSPAPIIPHQAVSGNIYSALRQLLGVPALGKVFYAPIDVRLTDDTQVQPDVVVVLNDRMACITRERIVGAPSLVVEVLSPSTRHVDFREKWDAYAAAGIPEYWIADPTEATLEIQSLVAGAYVSGGICIGDMIAKSLVVPTWNVPTQQLFT